ncbi:hypothetical protein BDW02DRAFT_603457 [Decorospora gaudefroyi]|uniref:Uncharacterized protein n=1 Tax=Decorospora gaudefroyi TaxID=184978 RepID=A0A6A5JVJ4_9PLEO|nr:hypothetical protein BDW02DRAFT_603457 [Decorospora gaudefroyi]
MTTSPPSFPSTIAKMRRASLPASRSFPRRRPPKKTSAYRSASAPAPSPPPLDTRRDASPGKRQRLDEDVFPGHSVSAAGSVHPLDFHISGTNGHRYHATFETKL